MLLAGGINHQYTLFIYLTGFSLADIFFLSEKVKRVLFMFSDNKIRLARGDRTGKIKGAKVAIRNPCIFGLYS
jgi:hypothetical protein